MKRLVLALVLVLVAACQMQDLDPKRYVTIEEAEAAAGEKDLHVEKDTTGAFQYARVDHTSLLTVRIAKGSEYKNWKTAPEAFRGQLVGLGDDAFNGPIGTTEPPFIAIVKDNRAVKIAGNVPYERLEKLAQTAASRM